MSKILIFAAVLSIVLGGGAFFYAYADSSSQTSGLTTYDSPSMDQPSSDYDSPSMDQPSRDYDLRTEGNNGDLKGENTWERDDLNPPHE